MTFQHYKIFCINGKYGASRENMMSVCGSLLAPTSAAWVSCKRFRFGHKASEMQKALTFLVQHLDSPTYLVQLERLHELHVSIRGKQYVPAPVPSVPNQVQMGQSPSVSQRQAYRHRYFYRTQPTAGREQSVRKHYGAFHSPQTLPCPSLPSLYSGYCRHPNCGLQESAPGRCTSFSQEIFWHMQDMSKFMLEHLVEECQFIIVVAMLQ